MRRTDRRRRSTIGSLAAALVLTGALLAGRVDRSPASTLRTFPLVTIPVLGTVSWQCDFTRSYRLAYDPSRESASTRLVWSSGGNRHRLRRGAIPPERRVWFPRTGERVQRLRIVMMREPGTIVSVVTVDFGPATRRLHCYPYLPPALTVSQSGLSG